MSASAISRLGIGGGALLIAKLGIGEATAGAVGSSFVCQYQIQMAVGTNYAAAYRIEGQLPVNLLLGGGGPDDDDWADPRVKKFLEEAKRAALARFVQAETNTSPAGITHGEPARVRLPAVAVATDKSDLEEIEELLMLLD